MQKIQPELHPSAPYRFKGTFPDACHCIKISADRMELIVLMSGTASPSHAKLALQGYVRNVRNI